MLLKSVRQGCLSSAGKLEAKQQEQLEQQQQQEQQWQQLTSQTDKQGGKGMLY